MLFLKSEQKWCEHHARIINLDGNPIWLCKETDKPVIIMSFERQFSGTTYAIFHLFCEACGEWPTFAELDAIPINSIDDLVEMAW